MIEIELKFQVPSERRDSLVARLDMATARRQRLRALYFDTADGRLAAQKVSLRLRKEGRVWVQTLKAPGDSAVQRLEHNVARPGRWGEAAPALDLALHAGTPAGDALQAALQAAPAARSVPLPAAPAAPANVAGSSALPGPTPQADGAPDLQVVYQADVRRRTRLVAHAGASIEVALDEGELIAGDRRLPLYELEFELKAGEPQALVAYARQTVQDQGLWLSVVPKAARGERLAKGLQHGKPVRAKAAPLGRKMSAATLQRAAVGACLAQVLANASEVADGCRQAEHIHQLRVGLRRLRTVLRELADLGPGLDPSWEAPLALAFAELGELRDRETVGGAVAAQLAAAGAPPMALPRAATPPADPVDTVRGAAFQRALLELLGFTLAPAAAKGEGEAAESELKPKAAVRAKLAHLHRQVLRDGARFDELDEDRQHRVRKRLKRLRYLAELVGGLFDRKDLKRYLASLGPAQDALGEHNDAVVALAMYREAAQQGQGTAWFAVGWLQARLPISARHCCKVLAKAASAPRFW